MRRITVMGLGLAVAAVATGLLLWRRPWERPAERRFPPRAA